MAQAAIRRPRVFVSSTVKDLRDLRSALRYWLEEADYDVQLSEYSDFDHSIDEDAIEACLTNVRRSDYYILLIGERRGTWIDEANGVTVTRQEFRTARDVEQERPIGISVFIRREAQAALHQWQADGQPETKDGPLQDPGFTLDFLNEASEPPHGAKGPRFYTSFGDFRDIINALQITLRIETNFDRRLIERNLLQEILHNLTLLVTKGSGRGTLMPNFGFATRRRREIEIRQDDIGGGTTMVTPRQLSDLAFLFFAMPREPLRHQMIRDALERGLYLEADIATGTLETTVEHEAMRQLREDMLLFERRREAPAFKAALEQFFLLGRSVNTGETTNDVQVDTDTLSLAVALHDTLEDVFNGLVKLAEWLRRVADSPAIERSPVTPIEGMAEEIREQSATTAEIDWAITNQVFPFGTNLDADAREVAKEAEPSYFEQLREVIPIELADDDRLRSIISDSFDNTVIEPYEEPPPPQRRIRRRDA